MGAVRAGRDGVRLTADVATGHDLPGRKVDHGDMAAGCRVALRRVDADQRPLTHDRHRGRLAVEREQAGRLRRRGVGDADEADPFTRAVGVDQRHAVRRRRHDLRDRLTGRIGAGGQIQVDRQGRDALEIGASTLGTSRAGGQRQRSGGRGEQDTAAIATGHDLPQ
jgi:hypothetical protein